MTRLLGRLRLSGLSRLTVSSARVALAAVGIVALVYVVVALGVVVIVQRNLTSQIDGQLHDTLTDISHAPRHPDGEGFGPPKAGPPGGDRFGPPVLVWTIHPDGTVAASNPNAPLSRQYWSVRGPETITVGGSEVRVEGTAVGDDRVVVGISMASVVQARSTVVLAEAIVGPVLLAAVFLGAMTIGRRVAAPIEEARRRQMEFTADASHELRTPLSVIEATTTLALARDRESAWYRSAFQRVHVESERIRRLVEDLLWLARLDATRSQANAEPVDVGVVAEQAVDRFRTRAETRELSLSLSVSGEPVVITTPPEWLDRLLGVLLDNACKYSAVGGSVRVLVSNDGGKVRLTVDDSGPGIPPEERSRIFDRFHRATDGTAGGAGLGLAIADAIVRASGGRWEVGTSEQGGARMAVTWPRTLAGHRRASSEDGRRWET